MSILLFLDSGCRFQEPLDMNNFQIPEGFNLDAVVEAVTKVRTCCHSIRVADVQSVMLQGAGWIKLEQMYSAADVERAKEVVYHHNQADKRNTTLNKHKHETRDEAHNKYNGLVWALFNKGRIFEKMAQHPVILNISNVILGETSQISSLAANTVLPGQEGQLPHLDYPYYRCSTPQQ